MWRYTQLILWRALALISLVLGVIGIPLPGLPTVPFMLLSAWAAGKGWPQLERRLLAHPHFGPAIIQWRRYGIVPRRAKVLASIMMLLSAVLIQFGGAALWLRLGLPFFLLLIAIWLWLRPESL
jgi:uncharacterized protein